MRRLPRLTNSCREPVADLDDALTQLRTSFERFVKLPDDVWTEVRRPWRLRRVHRGDILTREGATERTFSLVLDGTQRVYFLTPDGREVTVAFAYPFNYSGIPSSFFLQQPSAYFLEALTDGEILAIDHSSFEALMEEHTGAVGVETPGDGVGGPRKARA